MNYLRRTMKDLAAAEDGAAGPIIAISLFALIGAGGLAFDYARMAALDTELQNAADQAALAAATQLDGRPGAIARATAAAQALLTNNTLFATDSGGKAVAALTPTFYVGYNSASDTFGASTTDDAKAKVVQVTVGARTAHFTLTPIMPLVSPKGWTMNAQAAAGLGTAVCKVPPVMMCNPDETGDPTFSTNYTGKGILLVARNNTADAYGPGNFGFLDTGYDASDADNPNSGGARNLRRALAQMNFLADCLSGDTVTTEPGATSPALDAINTRFDIYANNVQQNDICGQGQCPPSTNVRKDLVREANNNNGGTIKNFCKPASEDSGAKGWKLPTTGRYVPDSNAELTQADRDKLSPMGHPRDICHAYNPATGCAGGRIGTGNWDRDAYFYANYRFTHSQWVSAVGLGETPTRYQVYLWELTHNLTTDPAGYSQTPSIAPGKVYTAPVCHPSGAVTPNGDIDRRRLTVAVVNCNGTPAVQGKTPGVPVKKWVDVFLVEPSWARDRTTANDLYIEVIGEASITSEGGQAFQVERSVPYLIR